jgi:hypothetical protein
MRFVYLLLAAVSVLPLVRMQAHAERFGTVFHQIWKFAATGCWTKLRRIRHLRWRGMSTAFIQSRRECIGNGGSASTHPDAATLAGIGERILKYAQAGAWTFC